MLEALIALVSRLARYLRIRHEYKKNEIEMEVLTKKLKENRNWKAYGNK